VPHIPNDSMSHVTTIRAQVSQNVHVHEKPTSRPYERDSETTNGCQSNQTMDALDNEIVTASVASLLVRPLPLPASALETYAGCETPNVVVIGVPYEPSHAPADELMRSAPPRVLGALRVLRHRLEQRRGDESLVVSVQSAAEGEGKTTIAARLALTLAEAERARVVLVEGNLSRPKLAATLGLRLPDELGLTTQIRKHMGGHSDPWSVVRIGPSLFALVESTDECAFPAALHSMWFRTVIRALKETYDYIVLDGCAVLDAGDGNVLEEVSDAVVLIARSGVTRGSKLVSAARQLGDRRLFGVVLNDVPTRQS
jgi:Mrp family chromosome partitioning ATPase